MSGSAVNLRVHILTPQLLGFPRVILVIVCKITPACWLGLSGQHPCPTLFQCGLSSMGIFIVLCNGLGKHWILGFLSTSFRWLVFCILSRL